MVRFNVITSRRSGEVPEDFEVQITRDDFREFPSWLVERLEFQGVGRNWEVIRGGKRNPVIKGEDNRIAMQWDDGKAELSMSLANESVRAATITELEDKSGEEADSNDGFNEPTDSLEGYIDQETGEPRFGDPDVEGEVGPVMKPFSHEEAGYREEGDEEFRRRHKKCRDCAHYDDNGNCHIVPDIDPDGYCEEFYADVGVFGVRDGSVSRTNLFLIGHGFDWVNASVREFIRKAKDRLMDEAEH